MDATRGEIEIRVLSDDDAEAVRRLAERDSAEVPPGALLGAALDGRLAAVYSLATGASIADPFLPSAALGPLLASRARQLRGGGRGWRPRLMRRRSRGALPEAGGRLLET